MKMLLISLLVALTACGKGHTKTVVNTVSVPVPAVTISELDRVVSEVNDLREKQGQLPLSPGLVCTLYNNTGAAGVFPNSATSFPATLPAAVGSWSYMGDFSEEDGPASAGLALVPSALRTAFSYDYAVRCSGQLVVTKPDYYSFELRSDDAALLYIGGTLVTGLNTLHGPTTTTGSKFLARGIHSFRLDYMQDSGSQALKLNVPSANFWR